jgi:hypothetical protein
MGNNPENVMSTDEVKDEKIKQAGNELYLIVANIQVAMKSRQYLQVKPEDLAKALDQWEKVTK